MKLPLANRRKTLRYSLAAVAAAGLAVASAACSGEGDDDDGASPTPTAAVPDYCVLEWQADGGGGTVNVYRITMNADRWANPSNAYSDTSGVFAIAAFKVPLNATSLFEAARVTSPSNGGFTINATGIEEGDTIAFSDTQHQPVFVLTTALQRTALAGSAGVGSFEGSWSGFESPPHLADFGVGQITIIGTVPAPVITLPSATTTAFGICYHGTGVGISFATEFPLRGRE